jgi:hypothetical protein
MKEEEARGTWENQNVQRFWQRVLLLFVVGGLTKCGEPPLRHALIIHSGSNAVAQVVKILGQSRRGREPDDIG